MRAKLQQPELADLKPALVSRLLNVDVRRVYAARQRILRQTVQHPRRKAGDPEGKRRDKLLLEMQTAIQAIGPPYANSLKILAHMQHE